MNAVVELIRRKGDVLWELVKDCWMKKGMDPLDLSNLHSPVE